MRDVMRQLKFENKALALESNLGTSIVAKVGIEKTICLYREDYLFYREDLDLYGLDLDLYGFQSTAL